MEARSEIEREARDLAPGCWRLRANEASAGSPYSLRRSPHPEPPRRRCQRAHRLADAGATAELAKEHIDWLAEAVALAAEAQRRRAGVQHGCQSLRRLGPGDDEKAAPDRQRRRLEELGQGDAVENDDVRSRDSLARPRQAEVAPVDASRRRVYGIAVPWTTVMANDSVWGAAVTGAGSASLRSCRAKANCSARHALPSETASQSIASSSAAYWTLSGLGSLAARRDASSSPRSSAAASGCAA